jgi:transcription antitermination factor NusG
MPLLSLEPFVFPEKLLTSAAEEDDSSRWWVLHTKPRAEKTLARRLLDRAVPFFLPLYQREWRNRGRMFRSYLPLFPSYVFLRGEWETRSRAMETNLVVAALRVEDQAQLHGDLARVYHLITTGAPLSPEERLGPGTRVEITKGAFTGLEGKVLRRGRQLKFFVEVEFLQRSVSVEIESWMFQACPEPSAVQAFGMH